MSKLNDTFIVVANFETSTNRGGDMLYTLMKEDIFENTITLSFENVPFVTTSFLNSSIGRLINDIGFDYYRKKVTIINMRASVYEIIKGYYDTFDILDISQKIA